MLVTLLGIDIVDKLVQLRKAAFPILVTVEGIEMLVKLPQPSKAHTPMLVIPLLICTEVI